MRRNRSKSNRRKMRTKQWKVRREGKGNRRRTLSSISSDFRAVSESASLLLEALSSLFFDLIFFFRSEIFFLSSSF